MINFSIKGQSYIAMKLRRYIDELDRKRNNIFEMVGNDGGKKISKTNRGYCLSSRLMNDGQNEPK